MITHTISSQVGCIRRFKFQVRPGQQAAYDEYLRTVVEPIDAMAFAEGAFLEVVIMRPMRDDADGVQCRAFLFRDEAQLAAFPALIAKAAAAFDGSAAATQRRKAYADTLRTVVSMEDYRMQR